MNRVLRLAPLGLVLAPLALAGVPTKRPADRELGATLYRENCAACHGRRALGDGPLTEATGAPPLAGRMDEGDREAWVEAVHAGRGDMPGYSAVFHRRDAGRVVDWLAGLDPDTGRGPGVEPKERDDEGPEDEEGAEPGDAEPEDAEPEDAEPEDAEPEEAEPEDAEPDEAEPREGDEAPARNRRGAPEVDDASGGGG